VHVKGSTQIIEILSVNCTVPGKIFYAAIHMDTMRSRLSRKSGLLALVKGD
jgi:hypothetical protein